ncbi:hypothetical protein ILYODFUR_029604 [Ilyodon furcidens]|uniref:Uncharacterized protein n=1 Tax=Ilyodon furcidens TaxID=33524 RepID=A0ABV0SR90_9TELE
MYLKSSQSFPVLCAFLLNPLHPPGLSMATPPSPFDALLGPAVVVQHLGDWEGYGPKDRSWVPWSFIVDPDLFNDFEASAPSTSSARGCLLRGGAVILTELCAGWLCLCL